MYPLSGYVLINNYPNLIDAKDAWKSHLFSLAALSPAQDADNQAHAVSQLLRVDLLAGAA